MPLTRQQYDGLLAQLSQMAEEAPVEPFVQRLRELTGTVEEMGDEDCLREVQHVRETLQHLYPVTTTPGVRKPGLSTHLKWALDAERKAERALTIKTATEFYADMARRKTGEPSKKRGKR